MNFAYVLRRIIGTIPLLLGVSALLYGVLLLAPGGPTDVYADIPGISAEVLANLEQELGLDQPAPVQYWRWLTAFARGDWGYRDRKSVVRERVCSTV